jgi:hypothetical protein
MVSFVATQHCYFSLKVVIDNGYKTFLFMVLRIETCDFIHAR